jgi:hypothetical protein
LDPAHVFNSSLPAGVLWNWVRAVYARQTGVTLAAYHYKREKLTDEQKAAKFKSHRGNAHMRTASGHFALPEDALLADDEDEAKTQMGNGSSSARPAPHSRRGSLEMKSPPTIPQSVPTVPPSQQSLPGRGGPKKAPQLKQPRKDVPSRIDMGSATRTRAKTLGPSPSKKPSSSPTITTTTIVAPTVSVRPTTGGPPGLFRPPSIVAPNLKNLLSPPQPTHSPPPSHDTSSPASFNSNGHTRTLSHPIVSSPSTTGTNTGRSTVSSGRTGRPSSATGSGRSRSPSPRPGPPSPRQRPRPSPLWVPPSDDDHHDHHVGGAAADNHVLSPATTVPNPPQSARGTRPTSAKKPAGVVSGVSNRHPATPQSKRPATASVTAGLATTTMGASARAQAGVTKSRFSHRVGGAKPAAGPRIGGMGRGFANSADIAATAANGHHHHDDDVRSVSSNDDVVTVTMSSTSSTPNLRGSPSTHRSPGTGHVLKPVRSGTAVRSSTMTAAVPSRSTRPYAYHSSCYLHHVFAWFLFLLSCPWGCIMNVVFE